MTSLPDSETTSLFYGNSPQEKPHVDLSPTKKAIATPKQQFLRFYLTDETLTLLPTKYLTEVLTISTEQIAPIPNMLPWIIGTYNWRGQILWLADLSYLLGFEPMYKQVFTSSYTAAILQVDSNNCQEEAERQVIGLVVKQIGNIERCSSDQIQPVSSSHADHQSTQFLQGYWLKSEAEILAVLDFDAILQAIA